VIFANLSYLIFQLYRECLRRAVYIGSKVFFIPILRKPGDSGVLIVVLNLQQYNTKLLVSMVRQQFKKHMHEKDPEKIQKLKDE